MPEMDFVPEELKVRGAHLVEKVQEIIQTGKVQRITVKDETQRTFLDMPLTAATGDAVVAVLAGLSSVIAPTGVFTILIGKI